MCRLRALTKAEQEREELGSLSQARNLENTPPSDDESDYSFDSARNVTDRHRDMFEPAR